MADDNNQPKTLSHYEIVGILGKGAMGVVFEAIDQNTSQRVALKTIKKEDIDEDNMEEILVRFRREAEVAVGMSHPNIVAVLEYGEDLDIPFIAMELIEGRELQDYVKSGVRFDPRQIRRIVRQLLEALTFCHERGICHRDLKPANIILNKDGTVKIADFGVARVQSSNLTMVGAVLGSPHYMSPEQITGQRVDTRADLYAIGVILYELTTGRKPFAGKTFQAMLHAVTSAAPPSSINSELSPAFDRLMEKALAKKPEDRYQTAQEFIDALEAAIKEEAGLLEQTANIYDAFAEKQPAPAGEGDALERTVLQNPGQRPAGAEKSRTGLYVGIAVGVAVLVAIAVGVFLFLGQG
jgi:serine/threonine-protein kinase